jgi:hypothetical protein
MTRVNSATTCTCRVNSSKLLWLYCLERTMSPVNNENFETLSENIWDLHRIYSGRACLYYISVFRNNASATVFQIWSLKIFCTCTNSDRLFSFLVFMKCYIVYTVYNFKLTYKAWFTKVYSLLFWLQLQVMLVVYTYTRSAGMMRHLMWSYLIFTRTVILVQPVAAQILLLDD